MRPTWMAMLCLGILASGAGAGEPAPLKTPKEKASYTLGVDLARNIRQGEIEIDPDLLIRGLKDGLAGGRLLMNEQEIRAARNATQNEMMRRQAAKRQGQAKPRDASAEENSKAGEAFLAENRTKEGVVVLPSGLQYRILKAGDGRKPADSDTVECRYRGTLVDGTEFDSSDRAGKPAAFKVAGVIAGWREALKLMPAGSKWQLFVPPGLAYGERGAGRNIGPNATLIFEVELLAVK